MLFLSEKGGFFTHNAHISFFRFNFKGFLKVLLEIWAAKWRKKVVY